jgi:UDP-N-acetylmuramyl pentapeptide phosphotransferase/UDP-N-acetylglucosamine-1-phosphate transferase
MKPQSIAAILLIVVAIVAFAYQGITYTTREKAVDLGPIQITEERTHTIPVPPIIGAIALVGGIVLLVTTAKKS